MKAKRLLLDFIKQRIWHYIAGTIILVITTLVSLTIPMFLGIITDGLNNGDMPNPEIYKYVLLMVGASAATFVLRFCWRYLLMGSSRRVECYMRDHLFKHLQTLPVRFYNNMKTGDLMAYAINDIQALRMIFGFGFIRILDVIVTISISVFYMVDSIDPVLTAMALLPVPIVVVVMTKLRKVIRARFRKVQEAYAAVSDKVQENISGIRVVKAFSQEKEESENFKVVSQSRVDTQMKLTKVSASLGPSAQISFGISFLLFIIYGSQLVFQGKISLGDYVAFNSYMGVIMGPIMNISRIIEIWQRGLASYRRIDDLLSVEPDVEVAEECPDGIDIKGRIEIKDLDFSYPGTSQPALKNINLTLSEGKTLGILGRTGSGKTTLVNLLLRLYNVGDGKILVDGKDINHMPLELLRERIGYVPQDNFLFSTTIRNNIEFFRPLYTDEQIEQATKMAGVYDNIVDFPEGFRTIIGERGMTLSGGQKQRISIARAFVKNPAVLILDDSLSAVDTKTEEEILGNIGNVLADRTGIVISHRVSTVMNADEIIFLEDGEIAERGTHEELMELKGLYYTLYNAQMAKNNELDQDEEENDVNEGEKNEHEIGVEEAI